MRQNWLCGIILTLGAGACNPTSEPDIAPPGTVQSAQRLILGFSGGFRSRSTVTTQACLNNTGACGTQVLLSKEDCHDYSGAELTLDGIVLTQVASGGYSMFGCTYPLFKEDIPSHYFTPGGPHQLTLRIGGQTASIKIMEMFENRRMTLTGDKLVGGSDAIVAVEPSPLLLAEHRVDFFYEGIDLNDQWCFAKNGYHGLDSKLTSVPADAWTAQGFSFPVPTNMPSGLGTLRIDDSFRDNVKPCPFVNCRVSIGHTIEFANVEVMQR